MPSAPALRCSLAAGGLVFVAGRDAMAEPAVDPRTDRIEWSAPQTCPDQAWVIATVDRYVQRDLGQAAGRSVAATGSIEVHGDGYRLALRLQTSSGETSARTIDDADCQALAHAAALMIAVAVDPEAAMRAMSEPPRAPLQRPKRVPPPEPVPADPRPPPIPASAAARPEPTPEGIDPRRCRAADRVRPADARARRPCVAIAGAGAMQFGALPRAVEPGVVGRVAIVWPRVSIEAGGSHWFERAIEPDDSGRGGVLSLSGGQLGACVRWGRGRFELPGCAGLELGWLRGRGRGISDPRSDGVLWGALALGPRPTLVIVRRFALATQVDLVVPLRRYAFEIEGVGYVHRVYPVVGRVMLALELRLP